MDRKRILLVDYSRTARLMEQTVLATGHYDIVVATDGQDGVEKAASQLPDLILMDVVMPRMSGFEACRILRSREQTRAIPIIAVTTCGELGVILTGYRSGCTDFALKPINGVELLTKVNNYIGA
jgi:CheY-like chemotaxis protein